MHTFDLKYSTTISSHRFNEWTISDSSGLRKLAPGILASHSSSYNIDTTSFLPVERLESFKLLVHLRQSELMDEITCVQNYFLHCNFETNFKRIYSIH